MHWNTFKQDNYSTVEGDEECRVVEVRAGTTATVRDPLTPFQSRVSELSTLRGQISI